MVRSVALQQGSVFLMSVAVVLFVILFISTGLLRKQDFLSIFGICRVYNGSIVYSLGALNRIKYHQELAIFRSEINK